MIGIAASDAGFREVNMSHRPKVVLAALVAIVGVTVIVFTLARHSAPDQHTDDRATTRPTNDSSEASSSGGHLEDLASRKAPLSPAKSVAIRDIAGVELPAEFFEKQLSDSEMKAYDAANRDALSAKSLEDSARIYVQYLDKYPLSRASGVMLNRLGNVQLRTGHYDDARRSFNAAKDVVGKDRFGAIVDLNIANIALTSGDLEQAEQQLGAIINKPLPPTKDVFGYAAQGFIAPTYLAKLRLAQGKRDEADQIVRSVADRAMSLVGHVDDDKWALGYVAQAYSDRVQLLLDAEPDNLESAKRVAEELRVRLHDHDGDNKAGELLAGIDLWRQRREMTRDAAASTGGPDKPTAE